MKKYIIGLGIGGVALAAMLANGASMVNADDATSTPVFASPGGYSTVCSYVLVYQKTCDPTQQSAVKFALDESYREAILAPWREVIFHGKYNHQDL